MKRFKPKKDTSIMLRSTSLRKKKLEKIAEREQRYLTEIIDEAVDEKYPEVKEGFNEHRKHT